MTDAIKKTVKVVTVPFEKLVFDFDRNPRDVDSYDHVSLANEIESVGLQTPLWVSKRADGTFVVMRGHRRGKALAAIRDRNPERFGELDPVACQVFTGLTLAEEFDLLLDHGSSRPLSSKSELYRTVAALFRNGFSRTAVAIKADPLFLRIGGSKAAEARSKAMAVSDSREREKAILACWSGRINEIERVLQAPCIVEETYLAQNGQGETPVEYVFPKLTIARINELYKIVVASRNEPDYDRNTGNSAFEERWLEWVEADRKGAANPTPRTKRKSADDIANSKAIYRSRTVREALQSTIGEAEDLANLDRLCAIAEFVRDRDPELWGRVEARYDEIRQADKAKKTA